MAADEEFAEDVPVEAGTADADVAEFAVGAEADDAVFALALVCDGGLGASTPAVLEPRPSF